MSDDAMQAATGRHPDEWFAMLDEAGAPGWTHTEIARHLYGDLHVAGWWSQAVTIRYEQARGMRVPGQKADGTFGVSATKTVDGSLDQVHAAMRSAFTAEFGVEPASSRADGKRPFTRWRTAELGSVLVTVEVVRDNRMRVSAVHEKLTGPELTDPAKEQLQRALARLGG
jgi:acyl-CoA synthetase (NDP forming)